jgi:hypothetical protein
MASAGLRTGRVGLDGVGFEIAGMGILVSAVPRRIAQCTHTLTPPTPLQSLAHNPVHSSLFVFKPSKKSVRESTRHRAVIAKVNHLINTRGAGLARHETPYCRDAARLSF